MSSYPLLNGNIDRKHRGALMEAGKNLDMLVTRTPKTNWMIHDSWVDRYAMQTRFLAAVPTARDIDNDPHEPLFRWLSQFQVTFTDT